MIVPEGARHLTITDTDILYLDMAGSHLVVINDSDTATELLEQRSVVYSDRVCSSSSC